MELYLKITMNEKLFLRNPEETELGKNIIQQSIVLIHEIGFEAFTFKKLAAEIGTTEAGVYRYFENKHLLLIYIVEESNLIAFFNLVSALFTLLV